MKQAKRNLNVVDGVLAEAADTLDNRMRLFLEDPEDTETMHKLRVSIRTLRSLLDFTKPWMDPAQNQKLRDELKAIVAETSRQRELDVLADYIGSAVPDGASEEFAAFCLQQAGAERERVYAVLSSGYVATHLSEIVETLHHPKWTKDVRRKGIRSKVARKRFDRMTSDLDAAMASLDLTDIELTHDVRKDAKRVRYCAEHFEDLLGKDAIEIARDMEAHQDNLGEICDARANIALAASFAELMEAELFAEELERMRVENEEFLESVLTADVASTDE